MIRRPVTLSLPARISAFTGLMLAGAIFGFFYAWVSSTMWGLDKLPAPTAIAAMQAMNASVRNWVFAPAFFGTGPMMLIAALLLWRAGWRRAATAFALGGAIYLLGGMVLTLQINVPMNEALALVDPQAPGAGQIWARYSQDWQFWNQTRTVFSGIALLLAGMGLYLRR